MRVMVVGAGLGGLTLAHGLSQAGVNVAVYERDRVRGRPQGVSLHIDDRGMSALRSCLPPGHFAMAEATMGGPRDRTLFVSEVDGELAVVRRQLADGHGVARPGRQASRRLLRAVLLTGLDDVVRFGAALTRFEQRSDGTVRACFADGTTDTADVLVGADGVGSVVRRHHLPQVRVIDTGRRMVMGATALRAMDGTGLSELIGDSAASAQIGGTMIALGIHRFAQSPLAARDQWLPAMPAAAVIDAHDHVMWALPVGQHQLGPARSPAEVWQNAQDLVAGLHPHLRLVVAQAWPQLTVAIQIGLIPPVPAWPASPVTIMGDAIHAAPGFGGNLAMRDAQRLRNALAAADRGDDDLLVAIGAYEQEMRRDGVPTIDADGQALSRENA